MIARVIAMVAFFGTIAVPLRAQSLDDIWKSEGYGEVAKVHGSKLQAESRTAGRAGTPAGRHRVAQ